MRAAVQRVSRAEVRAAGEVVGRIGPGLCVLACAMDGDEAADASFIAHKLATLRVFPDAAGKMNLDVQQSGGAVLLISQFTLAADTTSGTRPSYSQAMPPEPASALLEEMAQRCGRQACRWRLGVSAPRWKWSWSTTAR